MGITSAQNKYIFVSCYDVRDVFAAADNSIGMKFGIDTFDDMNHPKNKQYESPEV